MLLNLLRQQAIEAPINSGYNGDIVLTSRHTNTILHSEDAINWASKTAPAAINDIAYGNGVYVIICTNKNVYSSPDLITWTYEFQTATNPLSIAFGNGRFVIICNLWHAYTNRGSGWEYSKYTNRNNENYTSKLKFLNNYFVVTKGYSYFDYSSDGFNWNESIYNGANHLDSIYVNDKFVLATSAGCRIGSDIQAMPGILSGSHMGYGIASIAHGNDMFVMSISGYGNLYSSPDCTNWAYRGTSGYDSSCGLFRKGLFLFADGIGRLNKSTDGINWTNIPNSFASSNFSISKVL